MAATPSTISIIDYLLKEWYGPQKVISTAFRDKPLLDMIQRDTNFTGDGMPLPIITGAPTGMASTSLATARANGNTTSGKKFFLTTGDIFHSMPIGAKALKASRNQVGSFMNHQKLETDETLNQIGLEINRQLWGNGGGSIGVISTISNTNNGTIVLTDPSQIVHFEPGMRVVTSEDDGTTSGHAQQTSDASVASVDYNAGSFVFAGELTNGDPGDYLFREGMFAGNVSQTAVIKGVQAWCPSEAPTDTLFGLTRTGDSRLGGVRLPSPAGSISTRLEKLAIHQWTRFGCKADIGFLHPEDWLDLSHELQNAGLREITMMNYDANYGYEGIEMRSATGKRIKFLGDSQCPKTVGWLFEKQYLTLYSMEEPFGVMRGDGLDMLRLVSGSATAYEMIFEGYCQLGVPKPSAIARVSLT